MSHSQKPGVSPEPAPLSNPTRTRRVPRISSRSRQIGATALEYTLILSLASVIAFGGFQLMGGSLDSLMSTTSNAIAGSP